MSEFPIDQPVKFEIAPGNFVEGTIYAWFNFHEERFYVLYYSANGEASFVVRRKSQFKELK